MVTRELHLYRALVIADFYSNVAEPRADTLEGRPVYTIVATTKDGMRETALLRSRVRAAVRVGMSRSAKRPFAAACRTTVR